MKRYQKTSASASYVVTSPSLASVWVANGDHLHTDHRVLDDEILASSGPRDFHQWDGFTARREKISREDLIGGSQGAGGLHLHCTALDDPRGSGFFWLERRGGRLDGHG